MKDKSRVPKIEIDPDEINVHRSVNEILSIIIDFIPNACYREAYYELCEAFTQCGVELTNKEMRKEYEAWKNLSGLSGPCSKPE